MSIRKPNVESRIESVEKKVKNEMKSTDFIECYEKVREIVKEALSVICKKADLLYSIYDADLNNLTDNEKNELIFIEFSRDGYVVVVGAGKDYGCPRSEKYLNWRILTKLNKDWSEKAIFIRLEGLRKVCGHRGTGPESYKDKSTYLNCRNGVEMFIGEWLLHSGITILNEYSHKNYSEETWVQVLKFNNIDYTQKMIVRVVAAVIRDGSRIFATQRGYGDYKDWWEFPGGKIEAGETPEQALKREIEEELDTEIKVGDFIDTIEYDYPEFHLSMDCFWCEIVEGNLDLKEHEAAKWLDADSIDSVKWLPADVTLIDIVKESIGKGKECP